MGILMKLTDAITILFLTIVTIVGVFTNGHVFLPSHYHLKYVIDSFIRDKKHYLLLEKPDFFRALLYYHLVVNWPLAVISLYGFIFQKSWIRTTSLILAVSFASITVPVLGELVGSGKGTAELAHLHLSELTPSSFRLRVLIHMNLLVIASSFSLHFPL
ncbi:EXPERA domain-containing protein [Heracleum sosnowskyi]|uniref:EXPERA domain-containing protein n=1 Tax=Heracleum sosnowskyi TaxID=360622 RepID=A0AAD8MZ60_9APIA|nr:EXPERA domain-containing protein [Heracleum sosnowskyi]